MNKVNYNKEMWKIIEQCKDSKEEKRLLLHACCAPCSSTCMERVRNYFNTTVYFFNPNITNEEEYDKRADELKRLIDIYNTNEYIEKMTKTGKSVIDGDTKAIPNTDSEADAVYAEDGLLECEDRGRIGLIIDKYNPSYFIQIAKGYEDCPERGERCARCFELRLKQSAKVARDCGFDYFTTTLTLSPLKDEQLLNSIGYRVAEEIGGVKWLPSDFKKEGGYLRSIELSKEFNLYRQDYCGCVYSKNQREREKAEMS